MCNELAEAVPVDFAEDLRETEMEGSVVFVALLHHRRHPSGSSHHMHCRSAPSLSPTLLSIEEERVNPLISLTSQRFQRFILLLVLKLFIGAPRRASLYSSEPSFSLSSMSKKA